MKGKQLQGYSFAIIAAIGFGAQPLLATFLYEFGIGSMMLATMRVAFMLPIFALAVIVRRESFRIGFADAVKILLLALIGAVLTTSLLFTSYSYIDTGTATTLNFSYPVFVIVLGAIFCGERLNRATWISFALCIIGVILFCNPSGTFTWKGFWLALGSGLTYGIYVLYLDKSKVLSRVSFYTYTFYFFLFSFIFLLPLTAINREINLSVPLRAWVLLFIFSLDGGLIATVLLQVGIREIGSGKAAIIGALEPVTSFVLGTLFLQEAATATGILAMALIIASTAVLLIAAGKQPG